ncbi:Integrase [Methanosarcina siciliae T4/M]|uniref:Integrase n=1 Tax=Methanosarcina siciliae T4/M TaxID=1434120 RepID=A0A0E3P7N0_9EURY|nr:tyrosine-type recombinase/integrase [Methanosarcina siciliae]AKB29894.1 Integrase [Methanosarcina siciliae T4/M]
MKDMEIYAARLDKVFENGRRPNTNLELMAKLVRKKKHEGIKENTLCMYYKAFTVFAEWCKKDIMALTEDDVLDFLDSMDEHTFVRGGVTKHYSPETIKSYKINLRSFFKYLKLEDCALLMRERGRKTSKLIDKNELLTFNEITLMVDAAQSPRDKAAIMTLYEAGPRKTEFLSSLVGDVEFNDYGFKLAFRVHSNEDKLKTGERSVQLVHTAPYMRQWVEMHPCKLKNGQTDPKAPLWTSNYIRNTRDENGKIIGSEWVKLSGSGLWEQLREIGKKAGIQKRVNPHSFRHVSCTNNAESLTDAQLRTYYGWGQGSPMPSRYTHDPGTDDTIIKRAGLTKTESEASAMRSGKCPRCSELNLTSSLYCRRCGMPLTREAVTTTENIKAEFMEQINADEFMELKRELAEIKEMMKG